MMEGTAHSDRRKPIEANGPSKKHSPSQVHLHRLDLGSGWSTQIPLYKLMVNFPIQMWSTNLALFMLNASFLL